MLITQNELKMKKLLLISFFFAFFIKINAQKDQVTLKTGETLTVKIAEVTPSQIKFLKTLRYRIVWTI